MQSCSWSPPRRSVCSRPLALPSRPLPARELRPASAFAAIEDEAERSLALFTEAGKVMLHPRCVNCHPAGDSPLQGEDSTWHEPPVRRGLGGTGVVGMRCRACHMRENFDPGRVPGAHQWVLAPRKMAWEGFTLGQLCEQVKDPERNGGRTLDEIVEHMSEDDLVGWGWAPGAGRRAGPGQPGDLRRADRRLGGERRGLSGVGSPRAAMRAETVETILKWLLFVLGGLAASAVVPMVLPFAWLQAANDALGLASLVDTPLTQYLTRSLSAVYALFGAMTIYIGLDVRRYRRLIVVIGWLTGCLALALTVIDFAVGMPASWSWGEGPPTWSAPGR